MASKKQLRAQGTAQAGEARDAGERLAGQAIIELATVLDALVNMRDNPERRAQALAQNAQQIALSLIVKAGAVSAIAGKLGYISEELEGEPAEMDPAAIEYTVHEVSADGTKGSRQGLSKAGATRELLYAAWEVLQGNTERVKLEYVRAGGHSTTIESLGEPSRE